MNTGNIAYKEIIYKLYIEYLCVQNRIYKPQE